MDRAVEFVSRKAKRKQQKQIKKLQNVAYARKQKVETVVQEALNGGKKKKKRKNKAKSEGNAESIDQKVKKQLEKMEDDDDVPVPKKKRRKDFDLDSDSYGLTYEQYLKEVEEKKSNAHMESEQAQDDDIAIHRYSRLLGLTNKKTKIPKAFADDGLDMLLEFCNADNRSGLLENEQEITMTGEDLSQNDESDDDEPSIDLNETDDEDDNEADQSSVSDELVDEEIDAEDMEYESGIDEEEEEEGMEGDFFDESEEEMDGEEEIAQVKEDIYGRHVDKRSGELIKFDPKAAHKKLVELEGTIDLESKRKVDRSVTGIINRLSEATLVKSKVAFHELWDGNSKNDVKSSLSNVLWKMIGAPYRLPDNLLSTYGMFLALIHGIVSPEISSHFVEYFICDYIKTIGTEKVQDDKSVENKTVMIAHLINYRIIKSSIAVEMMKHLKENLNLDNLQIIYTFSSYVYKTVRKTCWVEFVEELSAVHIAFQNSPISELPRAQFLGDQILALKKAAPNSVDYNLFETHMKMFRGLLKQEKVDISQELGMGIDDLLHAEDRGRWWIVGSAFRLPSDSYSAIATDNSKKSNTLSFAPELLELASKAKMNTIVRKNIFCTVASTAGEDDAFEKLIRLSLKGQQEREIIYVLIHMMLKEKNYNAYYGSLISRFCEFDRRFKMTSQFALWDKIREGANLKKKQRAHLASLIHQLVRSEHLHITVLKVVEWGSMASAISSIIRHVFVLLEDCPELKLKRIFTPALLPEKNPIFTEGLRLFLQINFPESDVYRKVDTWFSRLL